MIDNDKYFKIISFILIMLLFLQRIAVPFQSKQIPVAFFLFYIFLFYSIFKKKIRTDNNRLIIYILAATLVILSSIFCSQEFSYFSLIYLLAIYFPFIFFADISSEHYMKILNVFQKTMVFFSIVGLLQFLVILAGVSYFDLFSYLPSQIVIKNFNTSYPIVYGSSIYKSNGIVFLEPSFFSQMLAMAVIIEIVFFKNISRMAIYLFALVSTFSGTGVLLLIFTFPFWSRNILTARIQGAIYIGGLFLILLLGLLSGQNSAVSDKIALFSGDNSLDNYYLKRLNEFSSAGSSASIRFVTPYIIMAEIFFLNPLWTGLGAGSGTQLQDQFLANFPIVPKLIIEYGAIAGIIFSFFLLFCFWHRKRSLSITFAAIIMFFFLSGSLLQPQIVYYVYLLTVFLPLSTKSKINKYQNNAINTR